MRNKFVGWALTGRKNFGSSRIRVSGIRLTGRGFTVTEIILVLFLLICLLIFLRIRSEPDWRRLRAYEVKQKAQFHSIDAAIEIFRSEFGGYPPSDAMDKNGRPYCGSMKLSEAMMGRDLMGFHPDSVFRSDGTDSKGNMLYPKSNAVSGEAYNDSLKVRKGPYLPLENTNAYRLADIYGQGNTGSFDPNNHVICDTYRQLTHPGTGEKIGMPTLYYKADTSKTAHDVNDPNNPENIYNYRDNQALLALGVPGKPGLKHPLFENPQIFYEMTRNVRVAGPSVPNRADTYILLSAGYDGLYGTEDDIANFQFRLKPK
jgi:hypothetical protein